MSDMSHRLDLRELLEEHLTEREIRFFEEASEAHRETVMYHVVHCSVSCESRFLGDQEISPDYQKRMDLIHEWQNKLKIYS